MFDVQWSLVKATECSTCSTLCHRVEEIWYQYVEGFVYALHEQSCIFEVLHSIQHLCMSKITFSHSFTLSICESVLPKAK